jgi:HEAT repeat protein
VLVINSTPVQDFVFSFRTFIEPKIVDRIESEWKEKPTEFLLKQLKSKNYIYMGIASSILYKRDGQKMIPILIDLTSSPNKHIRDMALVDLAGLKSEKGMEILIKIVKSGPSHRDYITALRALSIMKSDFAYPYVIELAQSENTDRSYAVSMLEKYARPESIPLLQKIASDDPEWYIRNKAKKAIEKINKLK